MLSRGPSAAIRSWPLGTVVRACHLTQDCQAIRHQCVVADKSGILWRTRSCEGKNLVHAVDSRVNDPLHLPRVNRTSVAPCCAPILDTCRTSSMVMYERRPGTGGWAKVQYPHSSRQSLVSGMNTCKFTPLLPKLQWIHAVSCVLISYAIPCTLQTPKAVAKSHLGRKCHVFMTLISKVCGCAEQQGQILLSLYLGQSFKVLFAHMATHLTHRTS